MKTKRFFVLPYSIHGQHIPHLMGRIVLDPLNPLRRFIPDPDEADGFSPEDVVPGLLRDPVSYQDRTELVRAASGAKLRARLGDYLGLETGASASSSVELRAAKVRRYEMANHAGVFRKFMAHAAFRALIEGLLDESKHGEALMVVGFYTAERSRWAAEQTTGRELSADVRVPVAALAGVPVAGAEPGVAASASSSVRHRMAGTGEGEEVFAVAYDVVKKKHALDRTARRWVSSTPVLGDEKRGQAGHLAMGDEASDGELEYESDEESYESEMGCVLDAESQPSELNSARTVDYVEL
ncbi:hypothetical protein TOPH_06474 [Tolypocladium ophioglossoides CBS 100239]|uniref:Uncharacterized protein n=1 Tax=Tolypocladium ophioglossoides (strain CBS 100239) TaxID=1163406 RepID=A0A0L0N4J4_TOLOC|nr:hypothetical protein TOPH_06474 [Tolypocladium ophioglossoides CBS 100239]